MGEVPYRRLMGISGGNKLSKVLQGMTDRVTSATSVKIGFLAGATYPDGKPVAMIAAIHNFGKWPFFSDMIQKKSPEWAPAIGQLLVDNDYDATKALTLTGEAVAGQLRQSIVDTVAPALAESTIKRKGFDKPLVETGHMLNSVDYEVVNKS